MAPTILSRLRTSPLHLILDWDGTLTRHDTLHFLGTIGFAHHRSRRRRDPATLQSHLPGSQDPPPPADPWREVEQLYADDYALHEVGYKPPRAERHSIADEVAWLASLDEIENRSVRRVEGAGLLRGVTAREVDEGAKKVVQSGALGMREGWLELLLGLREPRMHIADATDEGAEEQAENRVSVLSVNWSTRFIKAVMHAAADAARSSELVKAVDEIEVVANEIEGLDHEDGSSGLLNKHGDNGIRTSRDKSRQLYRMTHPSGDLDDVDKAGDPMVVYVGDSCTDFECLLEAEVGICIRDEPMGGGQQQLAETFERLGIRVNHVSTMGDPRPDIAHEEEERTIWWAKDLKEVAGMFRPEYASRSFGASIKLGLQLLSGDMKALEER